MRDAQRAIAVGLPQPCPSCPCCPLYGGNRKALPPWLRYDAVDTHEVRGVGLIKAPIHIVELRWLSLGWHGLSLSVLIDTLSSR